jgi:hypothetical protein
MVQAGRPFLVILVQKPAQVKKKGNEEEKVSILENENMIAEVRDYMLLIRNFYGIGHVFGIATTLFEWRIVSLPDTIFLPRVALWSVSIMCREGLHPIFMELLR